MYLYNYHKLIANEKRDKILTNNLLTYYCFIQKLSFCTIISRNNLTNLSSSHRKFESKLENINHVNTKYKISQFIPSLMNPHFLRHLNLQSSTLPT